MIKYSQIIAKTNANGELEFFCYEEEKPISSGAHQYINHGHYLDVLKQWEQSAHVFKAMDKFHEKQITNYVDETVLDRRYSEGVDVSNWVEIIECTDPESMHEGCSYAFFKPPKPFLNKAGINTHCPTCGSECKVEGDVTKYYVPTGNGKSEQKNATGQSHTYFGNLHDHGTIGYIAGNESCNGDKNTLLPYVPVEESQEDMWGEVWNHMLSHGTYRSMIKSLKTKFKITRLPKA